MLILINDLDRSSGCDSVPKGVLSLWPWSHVMSSSVAERRTRNAMPTRGQVLSAVHRSSTVVGPPEVRRMGMTLFDQKTDAVVFDVNFWHWRAIVEAVRSLGVVPEARVDALHDQFAG